MIRCYDFATRRGQQQQGLVFRQVVQTFVEVEAFVAEILPVTPAVLLQENGQIGGGQLLSWRGAIKDSNDS